MTKSKILLLSLSVPLLFSSCKKEESDGIAKTLIADSLRINEIQVIGSHNSYRLKTYQPIFDALQLVKSILPGEYNPDGLDYTHVPLEEQFSDYGVRQIELDIYNDPNGGLFYNRIGNNLVSEPVESGIPELLQPGMKMLHIADIDYQTNYYTFKQGLQAVRDWSGEHANHLPIFILIETKASTLAGVVPFHPWTEALPFDAAAFDSIDNEIRAVFGQELEGVITPDDVRDSFPTLNAAVMMRGWPLIINSRGKVIFLMNNAGSDRTLYLQGHPNLEGRVMFTNADDGDADAAFVMRNNPDDAEIPTLVKKGYIVRTRADDGTDEARTGDITSREQAFASGAQLISTDYYRADPRSDTSSAWTNYTVRLPNNEVARLNPVNGPEKFIGGPIE